MEPNHDARDSSGSSVVGPHERTVGCKSAGGCGRWAGRGDPTEAACANGKLGHASRRPVAAAACNVVS